MNRSFNESCRNYFIKVQFSRKPVYTWDFKFILCGSYQDDPVYFFNLRYLNSEYSSKRQSDQNDMFTLYLI